MTSIDRLAAILFWGSAGLILYAYAGYALVIWLLSRVVGQRSEAPELIEDRLPSATLLIAAYNEQAVIEDRLRNALATDYPSDRFEVVVGSDGSSDGTADIVRGFRQDGVRLLDFTQRRGKASVLNSAINQVSSEIVILSDANTAIDPVATRKMVRWFADPNVVAVCGRLQLTDPRTGRNADGLYWKYETFLKQCEGRMGAVLGSNGAIYAMRRSAYTTIPANTIVDDFVIPLLAQLRTGGRIVYEDEATAFEETAPDVAAEFRRRARIGAGGFQSIALLWRLLDPRRGPIAFTFLSHKVLRWLCPFFMITLLAANLFLLNRAMFRWILLAQLTFYAASGALGFVRGGPRALRPLRLGAMFTMMNVALLVGFFRWSRGVKVGIWSRTARGGEQPAAGYQGAAAGLPDYVSTRGRWGARTPRVSAEAQRSLTRWIHYGDPNARQTNTSNNSPVLGMIAVGVDSPPHGHGDAVAPHSIVAGTG